MKALNVSLVLVTLLFSATAMADLGPMPKSDMRDGTIICPKILAKQAADAAAAANLGKKNTATAL